MAKESMKAREVKRAKLVANTHIDWMMYLLLSFVCRLFIVWRQVFF